MNRQDNMNGSIEMHSIEGGTESLITILIVKEVTESGNRISGHVPSG